jgi:hypothetical protein
MALTPHRRRAGASSLGVKAMTAHFHLQEQEMACLRALLALYEKGEDFVNDEAQLALPSDKRHLILATMEEMQVINNVIHDAGSYAAFGISPSVIQAVRELDKQLEKQTKEAESPKDIVEQINKSARSNKYVAWGLIAIFVLMAVATFLNQAVSLFQNLG